MINHLNVKSSFETISDTQILKGSKSFKRCNYWTYYFRIIGVTTCPNALVTLSAHKNQLRNHKVFIKILHSTTNSTSEFFPPHFYPILVSLHSCCRPAACCWFRCYSALAYLYICYTTTIGRQWLVPSYTNEVYLSV